MSWLDDEDHAESIFGGDDYFSQVFRSGLQSDAFDPDSEEAQNYLKLAKTPPPSEAMYSDYMSRRPILGGADTKPSVGRRLMAAVAAMSDEHNGITLARDINRQPYENAFTNWKTEGANINQQALAADRSRTRELGATKELLNMRGKEAREKRLQLGLDKRLQSKQTAEELAQKREDRIAREAKIKEDRQYELDKARLRTENRAVDTSERAGRREDALAHIERLKEERQAGADSKDQAHEFVDKKYPEYFADEKDGKGNLTGERVINPKLTDSEKKRVIDLIKQHEDRFRRLHGLDSLSIEDLASGLDQ